MKFKNKIDTLAFNLIKHKWRYYSGRASVPDVVYDMIENELRYLKPDHPALEIVGTPIHPMTRIDANNSEDMIVFSYMSENNLITDLADFLQTY